MRFYVCMIRWGQLEPVHPGHLNLHDAQLLKRVTTGPGKTVIIREDVWNAYQRQLEDEMT